MVEVASGARAEVELVLPAGGTVVGSVVDATGQARAGIMVAIERRGNDPRGTTFTGDDGRFRLTGVPPGLVRVVPQLAFGDQLRAPGATDDEPFGQQVTVVAGQDIEVQLVVEERSGRITGRIVDGDGRAVGSGYVSAFRESDAAGARASNRFRLARWAWRTRVPSLTDGEGRFAIDGLSPGTYTLRGYRRGGGEAFAEGVALGQEVTLTIEQSQSLAGTVVAASGSPPAEFTVTVTERSVGFTRAERFFRVPGGAFSMSELPAGRMLVTVDAAEGATTRTVVLEPGASRTGLSFQLAGFVTLTGRMIELGGEAAGQPVAGMMVFVDPVASPGTGRPDPQKVTDADGRFRIERVPTGPTHIMAVPAAMENSPFGFARIARNIREAATPEQVIDVGEIAIPRNRIGLRDPDADLGYTLRRPPPDVDIENVPLQVVLVHPDGPAVDSGLAPADIIVTFDGFDVTGVQYFAYFTLARVAPGTQVTLGLAGGKTVRITAGPPR